MQSHIKPKSPNPETVWSASQVKLFCSSIKNPNYQLASAFLFGSKLRLNELLTLHWEDIDFESQQIYIRVPKFIYKNIVSLSPSLHAQLAAVDHPLTGKIFNISKEDFLRFFRKKQKC